MNNNFYKLLPSIYQHLDQKNDHNLKNLLDVLEKEYKKLTNRMNQDYNNLFVETCDTNILPLIASLLGIDYLEHQQQLLVSIRRYIANAVHYRRRKGQAITLTKVIYDLTGWLSYIELTKDYLLKTQHLQYPQYHQSKSALVCNKPNINKTNPKLLNHANTYVVTDKKNRPYQIDKTMVYLSREQVITKTNATPCAHKNEYFTFNSCGFDTKLYIKPTKNIIKAKLLAKDILPTRINNHYFNAHRAQIYGLGKSIFIEGLVDHKEIIAYQLQTELDSTIQFLNDSDEYSAIIDCETGRFIVKTGKSINAVTYNYATIGTIGPENYQEQKVNSESAVIIDDETIIPPNGLSIADTNTKIIIKTNKNLMLKNINIMNNLFLQIIAANGYLPTLYLKNDFSITTEKDKSVHLELKGLSIYGTLSLPSKVNLTLKHCILVNKESNALTNAVVDDVNTNSISIEKSIIGNIVLKQKFLSIKISDSIIDSKISNPEDSGIDTAVALNLDYQECENSAISYTTILGNVNYNQATEYPIIKDSIIGGEVVGSNPTIVRSYFKHTDNSITPIFISKQFNQPSYAMLSKFCSTDISEGANDGAELGAYHHLYQPQRMKLLESIFDEYLPFGLEAFLMFV